MPRLRLAFFSPMPPAASGIADYSRTLVAELARHAGVQVFSSDATAFDPSAFDLSLYQIGNNPDHVHAYETALRHPGVVVLHEANLHHLVAAATIARGDWDGYLRELEFDAGPGALQHGWRVKALEAGPDYDGVPMLRRLLAGARGLIAHSDFVLDQARQAGYSGRAARILHGAWIPDQARMTYRARLGLDERTPLAGIFGHLKPYKRIAECLRAVRRVLRHHPNLKMILAGEPHPDLSVESLIHSLGLRASVRLLGRLDLDDFSGFIGACDIILNLRYPTVGETSGTLLRAMGLGKAVLVSDVGAFREFPSGTCLRVPVDGAEEDSIAEYLALLAGRVDLAEALGAQAKAWVERECRWDQAAFQYASFLQAVFEGRPWEQPPSTATPPPPHEPVPAAEIRRWAGADEASRSYVETHITRLEKTLDLVPAGTPDDRILEMGSYLQITPALKTRLGYGEVRGCYYGPAGGADHKRKVSADGEEFACTLDLFDAATDRFPYPDACFATVLCCELLEHLPHDPMHMMAEINRIVLDGGHLVLTTPNIGSLRSVAAILEGYHPGFFPAYLKPAGPGAAIEARHAREYTPKEIYRLLSDAGFTVLRLETGPFLARSEPELLWVEDLLDRYQLPRDLRGDGIYALARKTGPLRRRWPEWLYT